MEGDPTSVQTSLEWVASTPGSSYPFLHAWMVWAAVVLYVYVCMCVMSMCVGISLPGPESFRREAWARKSLCCAGEWLGNPHVTLVGREACACAAEGSPT